MNEQSIKKILEKLIDDNQHIKVKFKNIFNEVSTLTFQLEELHEDIASFRKRMNEFNQILSECLTLSEKDSLKKHYNEVDSEFRWTE